MTRMDWIGLGALAVVCVVGSLVRLRAHVRRRRHEPYRYDALARYNTERAHGITHTAEWDARMAEMQAEFDAEMRERYPDVEFRGEGRTIV